MRSNNLITINKTINCKHTINHYSHLYLLSARVRAPKATTVTKMAQMTSRYTASHRDVIKSRNQASGFLNRNKHST